MKRYILSTTLATFITSLSHAGIMAYPNHESSVHERGDLELIAFYNDDSTSHILCAS